MSTVAPDLLPDNAPVLDIDWEELLFAERRSEFHVNRKTAAMDLPNDLQLFIGHDNQQLGPFDLETVRARVKDGSFSPNDLV